MRTADELPLETLSTIVDEIQHILWFDDATEDWDANKDWEFETFERIIGVLEARGLHPSELEGE